MVLFFFCVLLVGACFWLWRLAARPLAGHYAWPAVWRAACLIGAVRIGALCLGAAALREPGLQQGFGYFLLMLALPEIYLARSLRAEPLKWAILGSSLLAVSSLFWAALLIWVASRLKPPRAP